MRPDKRLQRMKNEMKQLRKDQSDYFQVIFDEDNKNIAYFLIVGDKQDPRQPATSGHYEGGYYICKIIIPVNYPDRACDYMMMTPNGRFEIGRNICMSNTAYHPELGSIAWTLLLMTNGFISMFNSDCDSGLGHIKRTKHERQSLASQSIQYNLTNYGNIFTRFDRFVDENGNILNEPIIKKKKHKKETDNAAVDVLDTVDVIDAVDVVDVVDVIDAVDVVDVVDIVDVVDVVDVVDDVIHNKNNEEIKNIDRDDLQIKINDIINMTYASFEISNFVNLLNEIRSNSTKFEMF